MQNVELKSFGNLRYCIYAEGGTETPHLGGVNSRDRPGKAR